jgi:hypothetical protein
MKYIAVYTLASLAAAIPLTAQQLAPADLKPEETPVLKEQSLEMQKRWWTSISAEYFKFERDTDMLIFDNVKVTEELEGALSGVNIDLYHTGGLAFEFSAKKGTLDATAIYNNTTVRVGIEDERSDYEFGVAKKTTKDNPFALRLGVYRYNEDFTSTILAPGLFPVWTKTNTKVLLQEQSSTGGYFGVGYVFNFGSEPWSYGLRLNADTRIGNIDGDVSADASYFYSLIARATLYVNRTIGESRRMKIFSELGFKYEWGQVNNKDGDTYSGKSTDKGTFLRLGFAWGL